MSAVLVVGVVLAVSAFAVVALTRNRIESAITDGALTRVSTVVALVDAGALAHPLSGQDPEIVAQVVDSSGMVVAADRIVSGLDPILTGILEQGHQRRFTVPSLFEEVEGVNEGLEDEGPYIVFVEGVSLRNGAGIVVVAASLEASGEVTEALTPVLGLGLPIILVIVGIVTWILTGRALSPVDRMRSEAETISAIALDRRLPLPEARDELHRLAVTLNEMLDRLETSAATQRRFVADASHELKSPLSALRAMVDVSARDRASGERDELLRDLDREIDRMERLVADLLHLARYDEATPTEGRNAVRLDEIAAAEADSPAHRTGVSVDMSGLEPVTIAGDRRQLSQLVRNLTANASRHASSGVWITTTHHEGMGILRVSDDGSGVPERERERIFERFVRLDESRTRDTGGAGLGLPVARAIAESHGGDLMVVTPDHGGATLEARFPLFDR